ncbi:EboA domain-containing protein [Granulosicoccaceae sp. 1_MG-2023]|nr:EboA domain-containing protein [Granulosicoccaceae sp. 1_MG-2023]
MSVENTRLVSWQGAAWQRLQQTLSGPARDWLQASLGAIENAGPDIEKTALSVMQASSQRRRRLGEGELTLSLEVAATALCEARGERVIGYSVAELAYGLWAAKAMQVCDASPRVFCETLFSYSDDNEKAALLRSLYWLLEPAEAVGIAGQVLRVNTVSLFASLALNNPLPARCLAEREFNQLALKSLFLGLNIGGMTDLAARRNSELARMADDYLHERRLAGRSIPPSIWLALDPAAPSAQTREVWLAALAGDDEESRFGIYSALAAAAAEGRDSDPLISAAAARRGADEQHPALRSVVQEMQPAGIHRLT